MDDAAASSKLAWKASVISTDNVSGLAAWISDTLCRLATGGGFAVRQLYTDQDEVLFDADPIAAAVRAIMLTRTVWTGTTSELLDTPAEAAGERVAKSKAWPDSPRALAGRLRRAATSLRQIGIDVQFHREGRARTRIIHLTVASGDFKPEDRGAQPSASSAPPASLSKSNPANAFMAPDRRTVANDVDGTGRAPVETVRANPLKTNAETDADGADAKIPSESRGDEREEGEDERGPFVLA